MSGIRGAGLTGQKAGYVLGLAEGVLEGKLELQRLSRYDDGEAREHLIQFRGTGPWTAGIYLLMALRRPDIWPPGDLALHKVNVVKPREPEAA